MSKDERIVILGACAALNVALEQIALIDEDIRKIIGELLAGGDVGE